MTSITSLGAVFIHPNNGVEEKQVRGLHPIKQLLQERGASVGGTWNFIASADLSLVFFVFEKINKFNIIPVPAGLGEEEGMNKGYLLIIAVLLSVLVTGTVGIVDGSADSSSCDDSR